MHLCVISLIFGVMENIEVRGWASIQFESKLERYRDLPGQNYQSYLSQRRRKLAVALPVVSQEGPAELDAAPDPGYESNTNRKFITFSGQAVKNV